jgi:uncharacterized membrane protein
LLDTLAGWNWEWLLGGNWLVRIGMLALVIGVGFFLKLAFDNDWIGPTGQVALGLVGGVAFLGAGEYWQRKYPIWAQPVTGGGIAILYLSIFAAFSVYELITPLPALGLFFLVTATAAGLALRYEAVAIAVLGIIGGFITPVMLQERLPDARLLLAYVLVLDLGVLALATFRNWRWFTLLGLLGSLGLFGFGWVELHPSLLLAQVGITCIFLIFIGATTLFHVLWRRAAQAPDFSLMVLNAVAYYGISYGLLFEAYRDWFGGFTLLLAVLYGLLAYAVLQRSREQVYLSFFSLGVALVFLTIAVPVQLGGPWISVAWAVEGTVLVWLSFVLKMPQLRRFALPVFLIFAGWLLLRDTPAAFFAGLTPFWNDLTPAYAVAIAAVYLTAYLLHRQRADLEPWEGPLFSAFLAAGNLFLAVAAPVQVRGPWVSVAWAVEGTVLVWLSFVLKTPQIRHFALPVFLVFAGWLLLHDTPTAFLAANLTPLWNVYALAYGVAIAATWLTAYLLHQRQAELEPWEDFLFSAFLGAGTLFLTLAVPIQVDGAWIAVAWAVEAAALVGLSFVLNLYQLRLFSLGVFAVLLVRLLALDTFTVDLDTFSPVLNLRFLAFGAGIAALYLSAYFAWHWRDRQVNNGQDWERLLLPACLVAANGLTLWLLSFEIIALVDSPRLAVSDRNAGNVKSLSLSVLWAVYAAAAIVLGVARRWRWVRLGGLALLAIPVAKLFLLDMWDLELGYRVAAFIILGAIMVAGGFLYQRNREAFREFLLQ